MEGRHSDRSVPRVDFFDGRPLAICRCHPGSLAQLPYGRRYMMGDSVTPEDYARARRLLLRRDPVLAAVIRKHGACGLAAAQRADHFTALIRAITGQQLSTKAAATIFARLVALMPAGVTPLALSSLLDDQLRSVGMSRQKVAYFR